MNQTSDVLIGLEFVRTRLDGISTENGYNFDPTVKRGWLQYIYQDITRRRVQGNFPLIVYRPSLSEPQSSSPGNESLIDTVTVMIDAAVLVKDTDTPVDDLLNLMKDVRRALVFDPENPRLKISDLTIEDCPFDIPESGDPYAFFSQKISFKVTEAYA